MEFQRKPMVLGDYYPFNGISYHFIGVIVIDGDIVARVYEDTPHNATILSILGDGGFTAQETCDMVDLIETHTGTDCEWQVWEANNTKRPLYDYQSNLTF